MCKEVKKDLHDMEDDYGGADTASNLDSAETR